MISSAPQAGPGRTSNVGHVQHKLGLVATEYRLPKCQSLQCWQHCTNVLECSKLPVHRLHCTEQLLLCLSVCTRYCADYYWRFVWYLPYFAGEWTHKVFNDPNQFNGCGGNGVWDLNEVRTLLLGYGLKGAYRSQALSRLD